MERLDTESLFMLTLGYLVLAASVAKLGSDRCCGTLKSLVLSIFLTPVVGSVYTLRSHKKNVLKIVHYRCSCCGLEHTTKHEYCPTCRKDGKEKRLRRICMYTY
jgi:hypothetical protein